MQSAYDVIIRPVVSERSYDLMEQGKYTFEVAKKAPKEEIAEAKFFSTFTPSVNTVNSGAPSASAARQMIAPERRLSGQLTSRADRSRYLQSRPTPSPGQVSCRA